MKDITTIEGFASYQVEREDKIAALATENIYYKERACCDPVNKWGHTKDCIRERIAYLEAAVRAKEDAWNTAAKTCDHLREMVAERDTQLATLTAEVIERKKSKDELLEKLTNLTATNAEQVKVYNELIMAVGKKYPGETRPQEDGIAIKSRKEANYEQKQGSRFEVWNTVERKPYSNT